MALIFLGLHIICILLTNGRNTDKVIWGEENILNLLFQRWKPRGTVVYGPALPTISPRTSAPGPSRLGGRPGGGGRDPGPAPSLSRFQGCSRIGKGKMKTEATLLAHSDDPPRSLRLCARMGSAAKASSSAGEGLLPARGLCCGPIAHSGAVSRPPCPAEAGSRPSSDPPREPSAGRGFGGGSPASASAPSSDPDPDPDPEGLAESGTGRSQRLFSLGPHRGLVVRRRRAESLSLGRISALRTCRGGWILKNLLDTSTS
ncbi:unnamed protein product [Nyctereutes procyonoides]|uniref:(raccoon dog) hypothetical protein n=1 Tax=Nyctereutes procyonoides TaxID=34880 RepID=A0A811YIU6_NYCPR|nr:unnamed protein product [Nyctereutes procyonoides]